MKLVAVETALTVLAAVARATMPETHDVVVALLFVDPYMLAGIGSVVLLSPTIRLFFLIVFRQRQLENQLFAAVLALALIGCEVAYFVWESVIRR